MEWSRWYSKANFSSYCRPNSLARRVDEGYQKSVDNQGKKHYKLGIKDWIDNRIGFKTQYKWLIKSDNWVDQRTRFKNFSWRFAGCTEGLCKKKWYEWSFGWQERRTAFLINSFNEKFKTKDWTTRNDNSPSKNGRFPEINLQKDWQLRDTNLIPIVN
mgnify:CR=1 FL=1